MINNDYKRQTNVLVVYSGYTTTAEIVKLMLSEYARDRNISLIILKDVDVKKRDIVWSDVVILIRGASQIMMDISKSAYIANRYVVLYLDDDLLNIFPESSREYNFLLIVLKNIDCFWTSNKHIEEKYSKFVSPQTKMVNEVVLEPWSTFSIPDNKCEEIRLVYAGSSSHKSTIEKLIIPALNIVKEKEKNFRMYFIGFNKEDFSNVEFEMEVFKWCENMDEYRNYVREKSVQIGLAPLIENDFTKCKFYNKYIEYTKMGIVGIYSNVEPYNIIVDNNFNGVLVENSVEDWAKAIIKLIDDKNGRRTMKDNAQSVMRNKLNMDLIYSRIDVSIPELQNYFIGGNVNYHKRIDWKYLLWMVKSKIKEAIIK